MKLFMAGETFCFITEPGPFSYYFFSCT